MRNDELTRKSAIRSPQSAIRTAGLVLAWTGLAILSIAVSGCQKKPEKERSLVKVTTTNPIRKDLTREVDQPGYLRPYEMTPIYAKLGGFAEEPQYDIGDQVKEGELLLKLYVPEVEEDLNVKAARVEQAKADLKQAKENAIAAKAGWEAALADIIAKDAAIRSADAETMRWKGEVVRAQDLFVKGVYDKQTLDQDVNQWKSSVAKCDEAKANLSSAKANADKASAQFHKSEADVLVAAANVMVANAAYNQWKAWLDYAWITAPFDGEVTDLLVHKGHFVQPSNSGSTSKTAEPLFVMMRTDIMRCTVEVPEFDAMLIRRGDKALIKFQALPGVETIGTVTRTTKALDPRSRTLRVELHLKNPIGAMVTYTASADGIIKSVQPTPPAPIRWWGTYTVKEFGGGGYPPNSTIQLLVAGGKGGGRGALVNAKTDSEGKVVSYTLNSGGSNYKPGVNVTAYTISDRMLRANMYANVSILPKLRNAWSLPVDAIQNDILDNLDHRYCFVVEDGKAHKIFLEVGAQCGDRRQILGKMRVDSKEWEPITGNEAVIITNNKALEEGQSVLVQAPGSK